MTEARVAICIATCRRPDALARLLRSLRALRPPPGAEVRVIVADNDPEGSAGAAAAWARAHLPWPVEHLIEPRPGVSCVRNAALAASGTCDFIAFIDDDEEVADANWLAELLARRAETDAAAVTGPVFPSFEEPAPPWIRTAFAWCYVWPKQGQPLTEVGAGNLLLDRRVLERHGLCFDEALSLTGGEDTLLAWQLTRAGETIAWAERARVKEWIPPARMRLSWLLRRWYRTGNTEALLALRAQGVPLGRGRGLLRGLVRLGGGVLALPLAAPGCLFGKPGQALRRLYTASRGLGMIAAACGRSHQEYRAVRAA